MRQRFEREARTISQLSHPHICALYDVGREGETEYLVMELLDGETLSDRLVKGPLPLEQTLQFGVEMADALDKAHRRGIVHRDLKPANVMLTKSGVKLLDFGLAKAVEPEKSQSSLTALPTQQGLTQEGTILGTFQYMAPEQLEGKDADARTDIFAFGAVLYEMATGKKAFSGTSQASLISAIMKEDPAPISAVEPASPAALDRVVRTCLAKDPEERWQSAADIRRELAWIGGDSRAGLPAASPSPSARRAWLPWVIAAAAVIAAALIAIAARRPAPSAPRRMELSIVLPERTIQNDFFALSPDGGTLAFSGIVSGKSLLRLRELGSSAVRTLPGTNSAESVFWSPDGRSLGFVSRGKLQRIDVATGSIEVARRCRNGTRGSLVGSRRHPLRPEIGRRHLPGRRLGRARHGRDGARERRLPAPLAAVPAGWKALSLLRQDGQPRNDRHVPDLARSNEPPPRSPQWRHRSLRPALDTPLRPRLRPPRPALRS